MNRILVNTTKDIGESPDKSGAKTPIQSLENKPLTLYPLSFIPYPLNPRILDPLNPDYPPIFTFLTY